MGIFPNQLIITKEIRYVSRTTSRYIEANMYDAGEEGEEWRRRGSNISEQQKWQHVCCAEFHSNRDISHDTTKYVYGWLSWGLNIFPPQPSNTYNWMGSNENKICTNHLVRLEASALTHFVYTFVRRVIVYFMHWHYWFYRHCLFKLIFFVCHFSVAPHNFIGCHHHCVAITSLTLHR